MGVVSIKKNFVSIDLTRVLSVKSQEYSESKYTK